MFNGCSAETLPQNSYSTKGFTLSQRIARLVWQNAERPDRAALQPLREAAAGRAGAVEGSIPWMRGPYYAIDLGGREATARLAEEPPVLRIVCVDNGIDGSVDVGQQLWLERMLAEGVPSIVVTGKPLVVDETIHDFPVAGELDEDSGVQSSVGDVVAAHPNVVATIAGDIHNAQRLVLDEAPAEKGANGETRVTVDTRIERKQELPPLQIVAGGGGAYLTPTHSVRLHGDGSELRLRSKDGGRPGLDLPEGNHWRFPSREQSVALFEHKVQWKAGVVPVLIAIASALVLWGFHTMGTKAWTAHVTLIDKGGSALAAPPYWRVIVGAALLIGLLIAAPAAIAQASRGSPAKRSGERIAPVLLVLVAIAVFLGIYTFEWTPAIVALAGAVVVGFLTRWLGARDLVVIGAAIAIWIGFLIAWDVDVSDAAVMAACAAFIVGLPLALLAIPLLRAFPRLQTVVPWKSLAALAVAAGFAFAEARVTSAAEYIVLVALIVMGGFFVVRLVKLIDGQVTDLAVEGEKTPLRLLWRVLQIAVPLGLLGAAVRWGVGLTGATIGVEEAAWLTALVDAALLVILAWGFVFASSRRAWRVAPRWAIASAIVSTLLVAGAALLLDAPLDVVIAIVPLFPLVALGVLLLIAGASPWRPSSSEEKELWIARGLQVIRDRRAGVPGARHLWLFRAMLIAGLPKLGEMAEQTRPPFRKSFLMLGFERLPERDGRPRTEITLTTYGVDDEAPGAPRPPTDELTGAGSRGAYELDRVVLDVRG
jgi:hypothetical protein